MYARARVKGGSFQSSESGRGVEDEFRESLCLGRLRPTFEVACARLGRMWVESGRPPFPLSGLPICSASLTGARGQNSWRRKG